MIRKCFTAITPPFHYCRIHRMVFDRCKIPVLSFSFNIQASDYYRQMVIDRTVAILNGAKPAAEVQCYYNERNQSLSVGNVCYLSIRGWSQLIGAEGFELPPQEAKAVQNDFADYITERFLIKEKEEIYQNQV